MLLVSQERTGSVFVGAYEPSAGAVLPNAPGYYGAGILNAASLEALWQLITTYPAFAITDFEVYPLSEVHSAIDNVSDAIRKMIG